MIARLVAAAVRAARAGRGRWVALFLLLAFSPWIAFPEYSPLIRLRLAWLDFYQIVLPRERVSGPVTIVAIDEATLREIGQWPWPRTQLAALIELIGAASPRAIGLDIVMPEEDQTSPEVLMRNIDPRHARVIEALKTMPSHDAQLADTIARFPVVLGAAGIDIAVPSTTEGLLTRPVLLDGGPPVPPVRHYAYALVSLPLLQKAAKGHGLISTDLERGVLRRVPLLATVGGTLVPALSLELVRVAIAEPAVRAIVRGGEVEAMAVGDVRVPTQPQGHMWLHYSRNEPGRYVSALKVIRGTLDPEWVRDKIVIVGLTGLAVVDTRVSPRGEYVTGSDVHAQMIESFFDRRFLRRPSWMPAAEVAVLLALGGLFIWLTPGMRRQYAVIMLLAVYAGLAAAGFVLFATNGILFDAASAAIVLLVVFGSLVISALVLADLDRRSSQRSLRAARESEARMAGELEAARRIQLGILPRSESSFPHERRFELAAAIEPARTVGGDLYDFFMLDADRLFVHIADVSGKGLPASLFMAITKVLTKSVALRAGRNAEHLLTQANIEISRDNPESLFVTAFAGILDTCRGELSYWTAGHDTPFVYDGRAVFQLDRAGSGPPLGISTRFEYAEQRFRLAPGSLLVLFTDGISEAENAARELYGKERLARMLRALPADTSAAQALEAIKADVSAFVAEAPASDDVTLMVLRWIGDMPALGKPAALSAP